MGELKDKSNLYTEAFEGATLFADAENRARKAAKIQAVLAAEGVFERTAIKILDIGCSYGIILRALTPTDGVGNGVDMDKNIGTMLITSCLFVRTPKFFLFNQRPSM